MRHRLKRAGLLGLLALLLGLPAPGPARAVTSLEQIDRLEAVYGALLDYRPGAIPGARPQGRIEAGVEIDPIPRIVNKVGAKNETVNPPPAIARARLDWSPWSGLRVGGFAIPPVAVQGMESDLLGVEAELGMINRTFRGSLRAFATQGTVTGPITDRTTRDRFSVNGSGADVRAGWVLQAWALYGGLGQAENETRLKVQSDGSVIDKRHRYGYGFLGLGWTRGAWTTVLEQHQTEDYLTHLVLTVSHDF